MHPLTQQIDELLPQTQCGQCGYGGCLPYAQAIATQGEQINRCPPGGEKTLFALAKLLNKNPAPFIEEIQQQQKPAQVAIIRTNECIGCTKCIKACPVDAIVGAAKQLHVIITSECTGCALCIEPCPVDCIALETVTNLAYDPRTAKKRHFAKRKRQQSSSTELNLADLTTDPKNPKKAYILEAIMRAKAKKFHNSY